MPTPSLPDESLLRIFSLAFSDDSGAREPLYRNALKGVSVASKRFSRILRPLVAEVAHKGRKNRSRSFEGDHVYLCEPVPSHWLTSLRLSGSWQKDGFAEIARLCPDLLHLWLKCVGGIKVGALMGLQDLRCLSLIEVDFYDPSRDIGDDPMEVSLELPKLVELHYAEDMEGPPSAELHVSASDVPCLRSLKLGGLCHGGCVWTSLRLHGDWNQLGALEVFYHDLDLIWLPGRTLVNILPAKHSDDGDDDYDDGYEDTADLNDLPSLVRFAHLVSDKNSSPVNPLTAHLLRTISLLTTAISETDDADLVLKVLWLDSSLAVDLGSEGEIPLNDLVDLCRRRSIDVRFDEITKVQDPDMAQSYISPTFKQLLREKNEEKQNGARGGGEDGTAGGAGEEERDGVLEE